MRTRAQAGLVAAIVILNAGWASAATSPCPPLETKVTDRRFAPGQVWSYTTRPGEESSTVTILHIDKSEKVGVIVHVRIDGLQLHTAGGKVLTTVEHMPFSRDAILMSTEHLLRVEKTLPTLEGYDQWKAACGGVYTISVQDAVAVDEKTLNAK